MLVENYLYADLRNIVAAGGAGKTTSILYEAMCGALGRPIWDHIVPDPFTTVIVTKEDSREVLVARLKQMLDQNALNSKERQVVWDSVHVIDLVGEPFRLARAEKQEITPHWENLERLLMRCAPLKPDRFVFDPLMSFGVGESRVNDAEQAIVEAGRHILRSFPGCAVDVIGVRHKTTSQITAMHSVVVKKRFVLRMNVTITTS
jgi:RecA-family ATPase